MKSPIPVTLTDEQRDQLENLWFIYGNHGSKMTTENHGFIQGFLERGQDERAFYKPTDECIAAVDRILNLNEVLLPCPFCGWEEIEAHPPGRLRDQRYWMAWCPRCGATGPVVNQDGYITTREQAIELWNTRGVREEQ